MQWFPFSQGSAKSLDTISMPRCGLYNVQGAVEDSVCQGAFSGERACGPRARSIPKNTLPRPSRPPSLRESVTDAGWAHPCYRLEVKRSSRHVRRGRRRQRIRGTGTWKGAGAVRQAQHLFVDASHLPAIERKQFRLLALRQQRDSGAVLAAGIDPNRNTLPLVHKDLDDASVDEYSQPDRFVGFNEYRRRLGWPRQRIGQRRRTRVVDHYDALVANRIRENRRK